MSVFCLQVWRFEGILLRGCLRILRRTQTCLFWLLARWTRFFSTPSPKYIWRSVFLLCIFPYWGFHLRFFHFWHRRMHFAHQSEEIWVQLDSDWRELWTMRQTKDLKAAHLKDSTKRWCNQELQKSASKIKGESESESERSVTAVWFIFMLFYFFSVDFFCWFSLMIFVAYLLICPQNPIL